MTVFSLSYWLHHHNHRTLVLVVTQPTCSACFQWHPHVSSCIFPSETRKEKGRRRGNQEEESDRGNLLHDWRTRNVFLALLVPQLSPSKALPYGFQRLAPIDSFSYILTPIILKSMKFEVQSPSLYKPDSLHYPYGALISLGMIKGFSTSAPSPTVTGFITKFFLTSPPTNILHCMQRPTEKVYDSERGRDIPFIHVGFVNVHNLIHEEELVIESVELDTILLHFIHQFLRKVRHNVNDV